MPSSHPTVSTKTLEELFFQRFAEPVSFVDSILHEAINLKASDILFEPRKEELCVRTRIDGVLYELGRIGLEAYIRIASRIKVLAKLDPAEKRKVQEGQLTIDHQGRTVNLRVEIALTIHGELIVIRIHERTTIVMELSQLGFSQPAFQAYQAMLGQRSGLILVCGPTGCGKTTTLYSTISQLNQSFEYHVATVEDPVEFQLENVNQTQVQEEVGYTFAAGLRTLLRLSPDVILVGEIRDRETAEIAVESGLTGQLVLSSLHAEDVVGALFRLLDLNIKTYLLNSALVGTVAQRLVRQVCPNCKVEAQPTPDEVDLFKKVFNRPPKKLFQGKGCPKCQNLAFQGRIGVFEVLHLNAQVRDLLRQRVNEDQLRTALLQTGHTTLLADALLKAESGLTTVQEALRSSLRVT